MKKLISFLLVAILSFSILSVPTVCQSKKVDKTSYIFKNMNTYKGKTYFSFPDADLYENSKAKTLPDKIINKADTFVMKDNKIHFKTYSKNGYKVKICSSNLKGGNIKTLVSNCYIYSNPYILNNKLYYEKYTNGKNRPAAINLKTKKKVKLSKKYSVLPQVVDKGVGYFIKDNNVYAYNHFTNKFTNLTGYKGGKTIASYVFGISGNYVFYYYIKYSNSMKYGLAKVNIKTKKSKFVKQIPMEGQYCIKGKYMYTSGSGLCKMTLNGKELMNKKINVSNTDRILLCDTGKYFLSTFVIYNTYTSQFKKEIYMISPSGKFCKHIATQYSL